MTDYKNACNWRRHLVIEQQKKAAKAIIFCTLALLVYGFVGYLEQEPVVMEPVEAVAKSRTQTDIETILPKEVAKAIAERSKYPQIMAAIAHTESRGNYRAVGDGGKAEGLFQVWPSLHGPVPDTIEGQVDQANRMFLELARRHGYRKAVSLWNGTPSNPKVMAYQQVVLAKVEELRR